MAADSTSLKNQIDAALSGKGYRGVSVSSIVTTLKTVADWVRDSINNNLTTWLRTSDGQPGGANTDSIYREGSIEVRGGSVFKMRTPTNATLGAVPFGNFQAIQIYGVNGGPAFLEFHLPGLCIHQLGTDTDGVLKFHPWQSVEAFPILVSGSSEMMALAPSLTNRKMSLYGIAANEHQFFGFGINSNVLRYQVGGVICAHIFYAGTSPATSNELMRITGDGKVGIGTAAPTSQLHVAGNGYQQLRLENGFTPANSSDSNGAQGQIAWDNSYIYVKTGAGWKRSALTAW